MKKIPIIAVISTFFLVVILMPSLGVTWWSYFEPTGNPNEWVLLQNQLMLKNAL